MTQIRLNGITENTRDGTIARREVDLKQLEKLESYVIKMVSLVSELKEKNHSLEGFIDSIKEEKREQERVVKENKKLFNERQIIRSRIKDMLHALEKMELI
ncbi:MAG: hypothetical protein ACC630_07525 [Nitrospinota bacterium]